MEGGIMAGFPFGYGGSSGGIHCLACVFSGILLCVAVYKLTGHCSLRCFKVYGQLSAAQKIEWNNRGFSTAHAVFVAFASFYLLVISDLFDENSGDRSIVARSSDLSNSVMGVSIGYFLTDLAMIFWLYPALGGWEYILHHGLSMFSIILSLGSGQAQMYILMVLFTEVTTPFVNLRWYLDNAGQKGSTIYVLNGIALFLGWLVARVILFIYLFAHMATHFDEVKTIFTAGFYTLLIVPPTIGAMNLFWFWKIAKGLVKTISKAKKRSE